MRVVLACHRYYPVPGGSERIAQLLAEASARRGDTTIVLTQAEPGSSEVEEVGGVRVQRLRMRTIGGVRIPVGYHAALRAARGDLFHLHGNRIWCADFYLPFAGRYRWPSLGTGHGFYQYAIRPRPWDRLYFERYFPRVLRHLDRYVCDTEYERGQLKRWGFPEAKLARIPLGADAREFSGPPLAPHTLQARYGLAAPRVAVYVGGFFENKRVDRLVEGIAAAGAGWALLAIGQDIGSSPYSRTRCTELARERGIEFRAPGAVPRAEAVEAIRGADVVLLGSEYEGFGVVLAEALAAGRPFISWPVGAAPEMAAGGGGQIVRSPAELGALLRDWSGSEAARRAGALRPPPAEWTEAEMTRRYLALYDQLAAAH